MQSSSPPDGLNIYEDHRAKVIASVVAPAILAIIAVALRLCARTVSKATLGWDDYLIILALVRRSKIARAFTLDLQDD